MKFNVVEYEERIENFYKIMDQNKDIVDIKISEDKWTLKEMVSHLIDSASNNHQRFIRLQLEADLAFPAYDAEEWKNISNVTEYDFKSIIDLWKYYNFYLLHIISNIKEKNLENIWEINGKQMTLRFIIEDYFERHMNWHIELYKERVNEIRNRDY